jgi:hypothetical protein
MILPEFKPYEYLKQQDDKVLQEIGEAYKALYDAYIEKVNKLHYANTDILDLKKSLDIAVKALEYTAAANVKAIKEIRNEHMNRE